MTEFRHLFILCVLVALTGGASAFAQSNLEMSAADGAIVPVGLLGQPDGDDDSFILPDEPDGFSVPATPPTTQTPGAGDPMAAARGVLLDVCHGMGGTSDQCNSMSTDAAAAELVQNCRMDPRKCCTDLPVMTAESLIGAPGACGY